MPCLANPLAVAELLSLSSCRFRNPTSQLRRLRRSKWREGSVGHADGAFGPVPRSTAGPSSENFISSLILLPSLCYSVMKLGHSLKFLCFIIFHFMSKSYEENIFDQISLTFLSFLVNSSVCYLLNIDYQIKFCPETEYIEFMFR